MYNYRQLFLNFYFRCGCRYMGQDGWGDGGAALDSRQWRHNTVHTVLSPGLRTAPPLQPLLLASGARARQLGGR